MLGIHTIVGYQELFHQVLSVSTFGPFTLYSFDKVDTTDAVRAIYYMKYGVEVMDHDQIAYDLLFEIQELKLKEPGFYKEILAMF